jgi:hypothetical protein
MWLGDICKALPALAVALQPAAALAHASDRGHVLLLPTGHYLVGGAVAVAASFLILTVVRPNVLERVSRARLKIGTVGEALRRPLSLLSFAILAVLVAAGLFGSRDPLSNPLPLTVWTLLWVGLTLIQGAFGNLWHWINPWYGPWRAVSGLLGRTEADPPPRQLPEWLGHGPPFLLLLGFAWFELVYPAPDDPARLAWAVGLYWLFSFMAMLVFGYDEWSRRGEFLSVFFNMISRFGIVEKLPAEDGRSRLGLCLPGAKLGTTPSLPMSGTLFLLAALGSVSFDGLSKTFFWAGANGINPLEFPGRTALVGVNSVGLLLMCVALATVYFLCVLVGERLAESRLSFAAAAGSLVWSIVPIALAYHFSHYLTALLVNGQYALAGLSDPFSLGWNLFGTAHLQVDAGVVMGSDSARAIWNAQATAIVAGHIVAVLVAHRLAFPLHRTPRAALLSQFPLTLLMIAYTVFGLWLLSTPTTG